MMRCVEVTSAGRSFHITTFITQLQFAFQTVHSESNRYRPNIRAATCYHRHTYTQRQIETEREKETGRERGRESVNYSV